MQKIAAPSSPILWASLFEQVSDSHLSLQGRIRQMIVSAILSSHLPPGSPVPSSRVLSTSLGIARNTVVFAYQQLQSEGYLESRERSGYFVAPDVLKGQVEDTTPPADTAAGQVGWSRRLTFQPSAQRNIVKPANWQKLPYPFVYAQFDATQFPTAEWRECCTKALSVIDIRSWAPDQITNDDPALIEEIRSRVLPRRGVWARPEEIVVTVGAQHALYLLADMLIQSHTVVGMEDPGYPDARNTFSHRTPHLLPLPIDEQGLCISPQLPRCNYVFVTPSHQCPTTVTLPLARREALLNMADEADMVIIEDDYETENRYDNKPTPALKSLDTKGRVIYVGSLSKSFAPGLRIGYIVAPAELIYELRALRRLMLRHPSAYIQRAFALFISLGHHHSLLRRLSLLYQERAHAVVDALRRHLPEFEVHAPSGGSSCWVRAPAHIDTQALAARALEHGVCIEPGHVFFHSAGLHNNNYIRMGFSAIDSRQIEPGIQALGKVYAEMRDTD